MLASVALMLVVEEPEGDPQSTMPLQPLLRFQGLDTQDVQCLLRVLRKELSTNATDGSGIGGTNGRGIGRTDDIGGTDVCGIGRTNACIIAASMHAPVPVALA